MVIRKLIKVFNNIIKVFVILIILTFIWFIGINKTLTIPASNDIRILAYLIYLLLFSILIRFVLSKILKNKNLKE